MNKVKENILATLAYFDIFKYPLTTGEIYLFLKNRYSQPDFDLALRYLVAQQMVFQFGNCYSLKNDYNLVVRRYNGNQKAAELIKIAHKIGDWLIRFPYVRGIAISGSLSKNYADENSDIDLFIITAKNRLWIARTIMHVFKKLTFLVGKEDYFCMNYYIDEEQLEIREKNIYTAIEVVTLIPLQGDTVIEQFYTANSWTREYLPNKIMRISSAKPLKPSIFKRVFERCFNNRLGNLIDTLLMNITSGRWSKKTQQKKVNSKGVVMAMETGKHFAKPDPGNLQASLLRQYEKRISQVMLEPQNVLAN